MTAVTPQHRVGMVVIDRSHAGSGDGYKTGLPELAVPEQARVFDHEAQLVGFLISATAAQEILALAGPGADVEAAGLTRGRVVCRYPERIGQKE